LEEFKGDVMKTKKYTRHQSVEMLMVYNDEIETEKTLPDFYNTFNKLKM